MLNFMAFFGARGCVATSGQAHSSERKNNPTTALRYPWLRAPGVLVSRNEFWREGEIRARSRSKATEIKEAYFTCRSGESPSEVPSRASCGMFWVDSLTETQERTCCVISVHIAGALACTRPTLRRWVILKHTKTQAANSWPQGGDYIAALERSERSERAPAPGDVIEAEKGIGP